MHRISLAEKNKGITVLELYLYTASATPKFGLLLHALAYCCFAYTRRCLLVPFNPCFILCFVMGHTSSVASEVAQLTDG